MLDTIIKYGLPVAVCAGSAVVNTAVNGLTKKIVNKRIVYTVPEITAQMDDAAFEKACKKADFKYRFKKAGVQATVATATLVATAIAGSLILTNTGSSSGSEPEADTTAE